MSEPEPIALAERQRNEDFRAVFLKTEQGMRVLGEMMAFSGLLSGEHNGNSRDIYNAGKRAFMLLVVDALGLNTPEGLVDTIRLMEVSRQQYAKLLEKEPDNE
jgi:hypothetical protein